MENSAIERIWELISRKLSNEATEVELQELQALLHQQPNEAYSLEIMEDLWKAPARENKQYSEYRFKQLIQRMQVLGIDTSGFEMEENHLITAEQDFNSSRKKGFFTIKKIAISLCLIGTLITGVFLYENEVNKNSPVSVEKSSVITTSNGSKTTITLPDGTKVWVNAGSKLTYENSYGNKLREVSLSGEAFFDVVHNAEKPFVIHTSKMDIRVLGTAFNVRCYPDEKKMETSLIRGSIEVTLKDRPKEKIYLKPNEKLTLTADVVTTTVLKNLRKVKHEVEVTEPLVAISHLTYQPADSSVVETSWVENKLVFRSETFEEVALKMEKWYGVSINIQNENLKQEHLTGSFESETVDQALSALQFTTNFRYSINKNIITITK
jgi:ferric-dicitrate binding protein FerR (iron transport regulator)